MKHYIIEEGSFTASGRGDYEEVARFDFNNYKEAKAYFDELTKRYEENDLKDYNYIKNGYVNVILTIEDKEDKYTNSDIIELWSKTFD